MVLKRRVRVKPISSAAWSGTRRFILVTAVLSVGAAMILTVGAATATVKGRNGKIAFRRFFNNDHSRGDIFTMNPNGTAIRRITNTPNGVGTEPDWSPDGQWILYNVWPNGDDNRSRMFKIRSNGTHKANVDQSCQAPCLTDAFSQWSPNGQCIAFQRSLGPSVGTNNLTALFVMEADGTHVRQITQRGADSSVSQPLEDDAPTWAPDGLRLAFTRLRRSTDQDAIFTVRVDGTGLRRVTPWRVNGWGQMDWSPDGRWLAFNMNSQQDVALMHPNGTGLHIIASQPFSWSSLSFSPNGNEITVGHRLFETGNPDIYTVTVDGTALRDITNTSAYESAPDWGPRPH
jgi:TolB protein